MGLERQNEFQASSQFLGLGRSDPFYRLLELALSSLFGRWRCSRANVNRRNRLPFSTLVIVKVAQIVGKNSYIFVFKHTHSP